MSDMQSDLSPYEAERLRVFRGLTTRLRLLLVSSVTLGCVMVAHLYLETFSLPYTQTIEVLKSRYVGAVAANLGPGNLRAEQILYFLSHQDSASDPKDTLFGLGVDDGIDDIVKAYRQSVQEDSTREGRPEEFGFFDEFIHVVYARLLTNQNIRKATSPNRDLGMLAVDGNDYISLAMPLLAVFVFGTFLCFLGLSKITLPSAGQDGRFRDFARLNFFSAAHDERSPTRAERGFLIALICLPLLLSIVVFTSDLRHILLFRVLASASPSYAMRICILSSALFLVFIATVGSIRCCIATCRNLSSNAPYSGKVKRELCADSRHNVEEPSQAESAAHPPAVGRQGRERGDQMTEAEITAEQYQERIKYENELLYTRVNYLFVLNGFAVIALAIDQPIPTKLLLTAVMTVLNVMGTFAIRQTDRVIAAFTVACLKRYPNDPLNRIPQEVLGPRQWLRPNRIMARYFPVVIILGWTLGLILGVASLR